MLSTFDVRGGFFCENGFAILDKYPIWISNNDPFENPQNYKFNIFIKNTKFINKLNTNCFKKYKDLIINNLNIEELTNNKNCIVVGLNVHKNLIFRICSFLEYEKLNPDLILFCNENHNFINFKTKVLKKDKDILIFDFFNDFGVNMLDFLNDEIYSITLIDMNKLPSLFLKKTKHCIFKNKIVNNKDDISFLGKIYIEPSKDIFNYKIPISVFLDEDFFSKVDYNKIFIKLNNFNDLEEIVEIDGELFSKNEFVKEFFDDINCRKQKDIFLKEIFNQFYIKKD